MNLTHLINAPVDASAYVRAHVNEPFSLAGAALIGGSSLVGGALSGLFGSSSQRSANDTNIMLAREANQMNRELYEKEASRQNMWNERAYSEYWKQREYDSIRNQRAQYEAAGINPYFALGNMQGGQAAGTTPSNAGAAATPQMQAPTVQAYDPTAAIGQAVSGVGTAVNSFFQNSLLQSQAENQTIRNLTQLSRDIGEYEDKISSAGANTEKGKNLAAERDLLVAQRDDLIKNLQKRNALLDEQAKDTRASVGVKHSLSMLNDAKAEGEQLHNDLFRDTSEWQRQAVIKGVQEIQSRINLNNANAAAAYAHTFLMKCESVGIRIDNFQKNKINYLYREAAKLDIKLKKQDLGEIGGMFAGKYNPLGQITGSLLGIAGTAAGAYAGAAGSAARVSNLGSPRLGTTLLNQYGKPMY